MYRMNYFETNNKEECFGCNACKEICPKQCIEMIEDSEGFLYPKIDKSNCIECKLCEIVCPMINVNMVEKDEISIAYSAYNKDENILMKSTSGAIFPAIANYVIENNGYVVGAKYNFDENIVEHKLVNTKEDYEKIRKSKYVRSKINDIYTKIKDKADEGKLVLFTGTPCEIAGLKKFLRKDYSNIILCDIMCHNNPSPKVLNKYMNHIEKQENSKIVHMDMRNKELGWLKPQFVIELENGKAIKQDYYKNNYSQGFGTGLFSRPSCHVCPYTTRLKESDITIGDFWGIDKINPSMFNDKGTSLIIVHTQKGKDIFDKIKSNLIYNEETIENAYKNNTSKPSIANKNRNKFFEELDNTDFDILIKKYMKTNGLRTKIGKLMSKDLKYKIKKIFKI